MLHTRAFIIYLPYQLLVECTLQGVIDLSIAVLLGHIKNRGTSLKYNKQALYVYSLRLRSYIGTMHMHIAVCKARSSWNKKTPYMHAHLLINHTHFHCFHRNRSDNASSAHSSWHNDIAWHVNSTIVTYQNEPLQAPSLSLGVFISITFSLQIIHLLASLPCSKE